MPEPIRVIHYLNQFFAGIGGEEEAGAPPRWFDGPRGPGNLLVQMSPNLSVVATVAAGDNYMAENLSDAVDQVVAMIHNHLASGDQPRPDLLIAGPAFNAGRYGMACAAVCQAVQTRLDIPAITALYGENPAVETYRRNVTMVRTDDNVLGMRTAIEDLARVGLKRVAGNDIDPAIDPTIPRGLRQNYFDKRTGAERAIDMLLKKLAGEAFQSEYEMPVFDRVPPAPAIDAARATIAVVTSGGIVPRGNPDRIEAASASRYGAYPLTGLDSLSSATHQSVHGGYDATYANQDPNRVLPLDALRRLEREKRIGRLHHTYFATVGNATSVQQAMRFGREIAATLVNEGVQAVILTST